MTTPPSLTAPGWAAPIKAWLEHLIAAGSGQHLPVVFDFDNTLVCGDIGEAVLATLVRDGRLTAGGLPNHLKLPFITPDGQDHSPATSIDLTEYYEALLAPTVHGAKDTTPLATGYAWAVEVMQGMTVAEVVQTTQKVLSLSQPGREVRIDVTPGRTSYPVPFFHPEMIELIDQLLRHEFDLWIVSASNVWSVRWLVLNALNPSLRARGLGAGISSNHVVGVTTLLADEKNCLYKDSVLVREDQDYAGLTGARLTSLRLTPWLQYPVPTYAGKVGVIWDTIQRPPYLCAGDSPGDHAMLSFSQNRLWLTRLEKPGYLKATLALASRHAPSTWMFQPVLGGPTPGFVADVASLTTSPSPPPPKVQESINLLESRPA
jgi:hypothetical protein